MNENRGHGSYGRGMAAGLILGVLIMGLAGCAAAGFYLIIRQNPGTPEGQVSNKLEELNDYIEKYYLFDYEEENIEDGIYKGMMAGLGDVYTGYYTPEEYADFMESTNGNYSGIGAMLQQDYTTGIITVVKVFAGSPAEEAGMLADDILYKVKGEEVTGQDLSLVVTDLKGEEGTTVDFSVLRGTDVIDMTATRRHIEVPTVEWKMLDARIGYIAISEFDDVTDDQFMDALDDLQRQGMTDLVIDLRDNGGGLVDVTCAILDRLLPEGMIVYTEDKNGNREEMRSDAENYYDGGMAVLVNGSSASASEIFAGAIKDYGVGTLVGTQTFGKGIVQNLFPLSDGSAVKITVSRYFTPAGNNIHGVGIVPDIIVEKEKDSDQDDQLQKAIEVLSK